VAVSVAALGSSPLRRCSCGLRRLVNPYPYANSDRMVHLVATTQRQKPPLSKPQRPQLQQRSAGRAVESSRHGRLDLITTEGDLPEGRPLVPYFNSSSILRANRLLGGADSVLHRMRLDGQEPREGSLCWALSILAERYGGVPNVHREETSS